MTREMKDKDASNEADVLSLIYPKEEMGITPTASVACKGLISQVPEQFAVSHEIHVAKPASLVVRLIG